MGLTRLSLFTSPWTAALAIAMGSAMPPALAQSAEDLASLLKNGKPARQLEWGQRYEHGESVARDLGAALKLYCRAAQEGNADAQYRLGWMYANGRGVSRNDALAASWFSLAAEQGDSHAQRMLTRLEAPAPEPLCVQADGKVYRKPLKSVPNPSRQLIAKWVERLAPEYDLDERLVLAVIRAESNFNPRAHSAKDARGLMQLIPATAKRFGVEDVWDPLDNLRGGMAYLRWLLDFFKGEERLAVAGYNAGELVVERYSGVPPYAETRAYVKRVSALRRRAPAAVLGPS